MVDPPAVYHRRTIQPFTYMVSYLTHEALAPSPRHSSPRRCVGDVTQVGGVWLSVIVSYILRGLVMQHVLNG